MRKAFLLGLALTVFATVAVAGEYTMISVPKLRSPWFNDLETGVKQAGKDFGIKEVYQQAPASADEAQQVR
ncbi:MAG: autoinducer 2 ABC transporter substrate-binding protein, partial [Planctomycetes bacterium]|nr:autoinducer 2 ABC transporter substrate-binding protein [Planctomycetota bacterium]